MTGVEGECSKATSGRSLRRSSFDRSEFLRCENTGCLGADHFADAGVTGDLNTLLCALPGRGDDDVEEGAIEEDDSVKRTFVDSPTHPGTLSVAMSPSYSKPELLCTIGRPRPLLFIGCHVSLNCGWRDGDPMFEEDTDAPDSEEVERMGGCSKECETECGDPCGLYINLGLTPCAIAS